MLLTIMLVETTFWDIRYGVDSFDKCWVLQVRPP